MPRKKKQHTHFSKSQLSSRKDNILKTSYPGRIDASCSSSEVGAPWQNDSTIAQRGKEGWRRTEGKSSARDAEITVLANQWRSALASIPYHQSHSMETLLSTKQSEAMGRQLSIGLSDSCTCDENFFLKGETRGSRYWLGECLNFTNLPTHRQLPRHLLSPPLTHNTKTVVIWCGCQIITVYILGLQSYKWKFFSIKKKIMLLKSQHLSWKFSKAFVKMRTSITSWTDQMFVSTVTCQSRVHCVSLAQRISYRPVTCDPLIEVNELTDMAHDWLGVAPPLAWGSYYSDQSIHQSDPLFYFFKSGKNWS